MKLTHTVVLEIEIDTPDCPDRREFLGKLHTSRYAEMYADELDKCLTGHGLAGSVHVEDEDVSSR